MTSHLYINFTVEVVVIMKIAYYNIHYKYTPFSQTLVLITHSNGSFSWNLLIADIVHSVADE